MQLVPLHAGETDVTKLQILNSACKLYIKDAVRVGPILKHLFDLCAADSSVDMRDRVRVYKAMFAVGGNSTPLACFKERIILCEKSAPQLPSPAAPTCMHALGSLSHCVEHVAPGYLPLPPHPTVQPPVHVRDQYYNPQSKSGGGGGGGGGSGRGGGTTGGDFYTDSDSDSDSESSDYADSDDDDDSDASSMSDSDSDSSSDGSDDDDDDDSEDGCDDDSDGSDGSDDDDDSD
jgi:AP-3 complex subunit beta